MLLTLLEGLDQRLWNPVLMHHENLGVAPGSAGPSRQGGRPMHPRSKGTYWRSGNRASLPPRDELGVPEAMPA